MADASQGIPPAPSEPLLNFRGNHALGNWDRERGFVVPSSKVALADLYVCWTTNALWLGLLAHDMVEAAYYRGGTVPKQDRALWTVQANEGKTIRARLGAGRPALVNDPTTRIECLSGFNHSIRVLAALELKAEDLGRRSLKAGDTIDMHSSLVTHFQAARYEWSGSFTLRGAPTSA